MGTNSTAPEKSRPNPPKVFIYFSFKLRERSSRLGLGLCLAPKNKPKTLSGTVMGKTILARNSQTFFCPAHKILRLGVLPRPRCSSKYASILMLFDLHGGERIKMCLATRNIIAELEKREKHLIESIGTDSLIFY